MSSESPGYRLADGVAINAASPDTFQVPDDADKDEIAVGVACKVIVIPDDTSVTPERLWVEIIERDGDDLVGTLVNRPEMDCLSYGDEIRLHADNVIDITTMPGAERRNLRHLRLAASNGRTITAEYGDH